MLVLHGILGAGSNFRSFARELARRRPGWGMVLVDLRMHGRSQGAPPPHTVEAAAADLQRLAAVLAGRGLAVRAVCGHSFGGKVALCYRRAAGAGLMQTWVLDASPGAAPDAWTRRDPQGRAEREVVAVIEMLEALPRQFTGRDEFVAAVRQRGFSEMLASWLAMSLERDEAGPYRLRFELPALRALMSDFYASDLWSEVERPGQGQLCFVVAGRSAALSAADRERLAQASARGLVRVDRIEEASHWLHVDAADRLLALVAAGLPQEA